MIHELIVRSIFPVTVEVKMENVFVDPDTDPEKPEGKRSIAVSATSIVHTCLDLKAVDVEIEARLSKLGYLVPVNVGQSYYARTVQTVPTELFDHLRAKLIVAGLRATTTNNLQSFPDGYFAVRMRHEFQTEAELQRFLEALQ